MIYRKCSKQPTKELPQHPNTEKRAKVLHAKAAKAAKSAKQKGRERYMSI